MGRLSIDGKLNIIVMNLNLKNPQIINKISNTISHWWCTMAGGSCDKVVTVRAYKRCAPKQGRRRRSTKKKKKRKPPPDLPTAAEIRQMEKDIKQRQAKRHNDLLDRWTEEAKRDGTYYEVAPKNHPKYKPVPKKKKKKRRLVKPTLVSSGSVTKNPAFGFG